MIATVRSITALAVLALALLAALTLIPTSTAQGTTSSWSCEAPDRCLPRPMISFQPIFACRITDSTVVFDENISLQYLHYAYAAFCRPEELETWSCQW